MKKIKFWTSFPRKCKGGTVRFRFELLPSISIENHPVCGFEIGISWLFFNVLFKSEPKYD